MDSIGLKSIGHQSWELRINGQRHTFNGGLDAALSWASRVFNGDADALREVRQKAAVTPKVVQAMAPKVEEVKEPLPEEVVLAVQKACDDALKASEDYRERTRLTREQMERPITTPKVVVGPAAQPRSANVDRLGVYHCPHCGYSHYDAAVHMDHKICESRHHLPMPPMCDADKHNFEFKSKENKPIVLLKLPPVKKPKPIVSKPKVRTLVPAKSNPYIDCRMTESGGRSIDE